MNKIRIILVTIGMVLFLLNVAIAQTSQELPRFIQHAELVLGFNVSQIIETLGMPGVTKLKHCVVPHDLGYTIELIPGDSWEYIYTTDNTQVTRIVCVVKNLAMAEHRLSISSTGTRIQQDEQIVLATDLIEKAFNGELDENSDRDRTIPREYKDKDLGFEI